LDVNANVSSQEGHNLIGPPFEASHDSVWNSDSVVFPDTIKLERSLVWETHGLSKFWIKESVTHGCNINGGISDGTCVTKPLDSIVIFIDENKKTSDMNKNSSY